MLQTAYRADLARLGTGRNSPDYHDLPPYLQRLADAASSARDAFLALGEACRAARTARMWADATHLSALELAAYNHWQELERAGGELRDTFTVGRMRERVASWTRAQGGAA